jgi:cysteine synthase A
VYIMPDLSILDCIGGTPLIKAGGIVENRAKLYLKAEWFNPSGSIKDRTAKYILAGAIERGELSPGGRVVEASSGNLGISLGMLGAVYGLDVTVVMPEGMSRARSVLMEKYGVNTVFTAAKDGMAGAVAKAEQKAGTVGAFYPRQFENADGVRAHYETTAKEILDDLGGTPDAIIAGVGTGGTLMGIARRFAEVGPCEIIAVEPRESPILSMGHAGRHGIEGIGAGFVPPLLDRSYIDRVITVGDEEALNCFNALPRRLGLCCGISSAAAIAAAIKLSLEEKYRGRRIVAILPDGVNRYI